MTKLKKLNKWDLLKTFLQFTYTTDFCGISAMFTVVKNENILKNKKRVINLSSVELAQRVLSVK